MSTGFRLLPGHLGRDAQSAMISDVLEVIRQAPLYRAHMPRTAKPMSVEMTNCGPLAWFSDARLGYRYIEQHPDFGTPWPAIPQSIMAVWREVGRFAKPPEACLINVYREGARMGLHQDRDEADFSAPIVSISLGDDALFRLGGPERRGPTRSFKLSSGDVMVLEGPQRLAFHGIDRVMPGTSRLVPGGGRINITLRRVT